MKKRGLEEKRRLTDRTTGGWSQESKFNTLSKFLIDAPGCGLMCLLRRESLAALSRTHRIGLYPLAVVWRMADQCRRVRDTQQHQDAEMLF